MNAVVAVLGQGRMGTAIAACAAAAGYDVLVHDASPVASHSARERAFALAETAGTEISGTIRRTDSAAQAARGADLVVEAVPEDLGLKHSVLAEVSAVNATAVIASNTSVIPVDAMAREVTSPNRFVGTHWWNPAHLIRVVEVTPGEATDLQTLESVTAHLRSMGKEPVRLAHDVAGFIGNRLQVAMWREALELLDRGVCDADSIDLVVREGFGRRLAAVGPCENMQLIGLPLTAAIMTYLLPDLSQTTTPSTWMSPDDPAATAGLLRGLSPEDRRELDERLYQFLLAGRGR